MVAVAWASDGAEAFVPPQRWYVTVSARRTSTSVATWLRWRAGSTIPGRFFRDLTGAMIL